VLKYKNVSKRSIAARAAEDDGAKGLYAVLFGRAKAAPKRKRAAAAAKVEPK